MSGKKIYLEDSLNHLKVYIEKELGIIFDNIEIQWGEENKKYLLSQYEYVMEKINHSIDHIIVDHVDDYE